MKKQQAKVTKPTGVVENKNFIKLALEKAGKLVTKKK